MTTYLTVQKKSISIIVESLIGQHNLQNKVQSQTDLVLILLISSVILD